MSAIEVSRSPSQAWSWRARGRPSAQVIVYSVLLLFVANIVLVPLGMVIATSLNVGPITAPGTVGLTFMNYVQAWTSPTTHAVIMNTLIFATVSTMMSMIVGVFFAFMVERTDMPLKNFAYAVVPMTIAMPGLLYGIAWVLLLSPKIGLFNLALMGLFGADQGILTAWAHVGLEEAPIKPYSMAGMIWVDAVRGIGVVFLMTVGLFRNMDPSLEEAASVSGAPPGTVANKVTLRVMMPGILAAFVYSFTGTLETFDIPAVMGLPAGIHLLSTKIYLLSKSDDHGIASSLGVVFVVLAIFFVWWYSRLTRRIESFSTVTGKGYRPRQMRIGKFKYVAVTLLALYLVVVVIAPFLVMLWASILPYYQVPSWQALQSVNLEAYKFVVTNPWGVTAVRNTLILTLAAPTVTMLLATLISWFVVRSKMRGKRLLDVMAFLPHTIPSIVIALAMIYLFLTSPWRLIPIYGTIWILSLAIATRFLAFGSRTMHGAVIQLHKDLEEAAQVGGVSWPKAFRYIVLPLLFPAIVSGWVFVALNSIREVSMALLLYSPDSRVVSLLMWDTWNNGEVAIAAATGVLLMIAIGIIVGAGRMVDQRRSRTKAGI